MAALAKLAARQSSRPRGALGRLWGLLLDRGTRVANRRALEALELGGDVEVLEIGFGGGRLLSYILAATDGRVAGLELSEVMIRRSERRFRDEIDGGRLRLAHGDVTALPFEGASFDRVVSVHTIYFWSDTEAGLREILRTLRPGGRLILGTATKAFLAGRRASQHGYRLFTESELRDALERAGFDDIVVERHDTVVISSGMRPAGNSGAGQAKA